MYKLMTFSLKIRWKPRAVSACKTWDNLHRNLLQTTRKHLEGILELVASVFLRRGRQSKASFVWMCGHRHFMKYSFYVCYEVILGRIYSLYCWKGKSITPKFILWKYSSQVPVTKIRLSSEMGSLMKNIKINEAGLIQIISLDHAYFNPTFCDIEDF